MAQPKRKTAPVSVPDSAAELLTNFYATNKQKGALERQLDTLKPAVLQLVPVGRDKEEVAGKYMDQHGKYVVTKVERDNRKLDDTLVMAMLAKKGLTTEATSILPDQAKMNALVELGRITKEDIAKCLVGNISIYPLVAFKEDE